MDCKQDQGQIDIGAIDLKAADKQIRAIMRQIAANNASVGLSIHRMMLNDNEIQKLDTKLSLIEGRRRPPAKTRLGDDPSTFQPHSPRLIRAEVAALQLEIERNLQLLAARGHRILLNEARIRQCELNLEKLAQKAERRARITARDTAATCLALMATTVAGDAVETPQDGDLV